MAPTLSFYRRAASTAALAWLSYAIVENLFLVVLPRLLKSGDEYRELHAGVSALLFVVYPLLGALFGLLAAAALGLSQRASRAPGREITRRLAAASLVPMALAAGGSLAAQGGFPLRIRLSGLAVAAACALGLMLVAVSARRFVALRPLAGPWSVSLLVLGTPWICARASVRPLPAALAGFAFVSLAAGASFWFARRGSIPSPGAGRSGNHAALAHVLVAAALAALGLQLHATVHDSAQPEAGGRWAAARPNVILVTLDTVRADHLSLYGYARDTSPRLGELATRANLYLRAIAPADMTLATHASIFSGLYPSRHGAHYEAERCPAYCPLEATHTTLAELLGRRGYQTAGVVANYGFLGHSFGLDRGFGFYDARRTVLPLGPADPFTVRRALRDLVAPSFSPELSEREYRRADEITDLGIRELDRLRSSRAPFFLFLNYMDAHEPYMPPPPWDALFPGRDPALRRDDLAALEERVLRLEAEVTPRQRAHLVSQYDGGIAYIDHELDRLWRRLEADGLLDGALVVVTSDHGEAFGERRLFGHEVSVYQEEVHVPLLVKLPGQRQGERIATAVSLVDLLPTLLEAAGVRPPPGIDGRSLFAAAAAGERPILSETFGNFLLTRWQARFRRIARAVFDGDLKLIVSTTGTREAFDLSTDPDEQRELPAGEARWHALEARLDRWLRDAASAPGGATHQLDAATEERLRSLGYL